MKKKMTKTSKKPLVLKRRLDLTNKKVQFFVVIGIVAILGGGYFTVKSFASTVLYRISPSDIWCSGSNCGVSYDANKNNSPVLTALGGATLNTRKSYYFIGGQIYRICAYTNGPGSIEFGDNLGFRSDYGSRTVLTPTQPGAPLCAFGKTSSSKTGPIQMRVKGTGINIYSVEISRSTPTPTLGK